MTVSLPSGTRAKATGSFFAVPVMSVVSLRSENLPVQAYIFLILLIPQTVYWMKPPLLILVLVIATGCSASGQGIPHADADTAAAIDTIEHYGGFYYENKTSKVGQYYQKFSHALSTTALVDLTDNWNPATRCYAFFALSEQHSALLDSILLTHLRRIPRPFSSSWEMSANTRQWETSFITW